MSAATEHHRLCMICSGFTKCKIYIWQRWIPGEWQWVCNWTCPCDLEPNCLSLFFPEEIQTLPPVSLWPSVALLIMAVLKLWSWSALTLSTDLIWYLESWKFYTLMMSLRNFCVYWKNKTSHDHTVASHPHLFPPSCVLH